MNKNQKIKLSVLATREKRKSQICRVFEVKILKNKLDNVQKEFLNRLFLEAKWFYNWQLSQDDLWNVDYKTKQIEVKCGEKYETREIEALSSQIRQKLIDKPKQAIKALAKLKEKGYKVGRLKYKAFVNCIPLNQFGTTYKIGGNKIRVQGCKRKFIVKGIEQIKGLELANANLIKKPSGYYFKITTYGKKEKREKTGKVIGLDFGIQDNIIDSNGNKYHWNFVENKRLKSMSKKFNRADITNKKLKIANGKSIKDIILPKKMKCIKTKNRFKRQAILRKEYEKLTNKKQDVTNKFVSKLIKENDIIAIQDELIGNWHKGLFGKQVQHSIMGKIKSKLKDNCSTIVVPAKFPSTQICPKCYRKTKHPLLKRDYDCSFCGFHFGDRDIKSALCLLKEGLTILLEQKNTMLVENETTIVKSLLEIDNKFYSMKQEAPAFRLE